MVTFPKICFFYFKGIFFFFGLLLLDFQTFYFSRQIILLLELGKESGGQLSSECQVSVCQDLPGKIKETPWGTTLPVAKEKLVNFREGKPVRGPALKQGPLDVTMQTHREHQERGSCVRWVCDLPSLSSKKWVWQMLAIGWYSGFALWTFCSHSSCGHICSPALYGINLWWKGSLEGGKIVVWEFEPECVQDVKSRARFLPSHLLILVLQNGYNSLYLR